MPDPDIDRKCLDIAFDPVTELSLEIGLPDLIRARELAERMRRCRQCGSTGIIRVRPIGYDIQDYDIPCRSCEQNRKGADLITALVDEIERLATENRSLRVGLSAIERAEPGAEAGNAARYESAPQAPVGEAGASEGESQR